MNRTDIEYLDYTWNPTTGCSKCSPGCLNCWAERMSKRLKGRYGYPEDDPFRPTCHHDRLSEPLKLRKPSRIGVSFMGDLFHDSVPREFIKSVAGVFLDCPQHTFFILTKRPKRMAEIATDLQGFGPNVIIGVTVCNQAEADEKIPVLLSIPAARRWISVEPCLGPTDLKLSDYAISVSSHSVRRAFINFIALGTESINGRPGRQPHIDDIRSVRDQCQAAGVKFMLKQMACGGKMVSKPHLDGRQHMETP